MVNSTTRIPLAQRQRLLGLIPVLIVAVSALLALIVPILVNQITLHNFSQPLFNYAIPPKSTLVSQKSVYGVLSGNGNHCDYLAQVQLRTLLNEQEIRDYYSGLTFPAIAANSTSSAFDGLTGAVRVQIKFDPLDAKSVSLSIFDGGYTGGLQVMDGHCH